MKLKRFFALILCAIMLAVVFIGCAEEVIPDPGPKDVIYKFSQFTPGGINYDLLVGLAFEDDMVYMLTQKTEAGNDGTVESFYLLKTDISGNIIEKQLLSSATEEQKADIGYKIYMGLGIGNDGEIYLIRQTALNKARQKSEFMFYSITEGVMPDPRDTESATQTEEEDIEPITKTEIVQFINNAETVLADISGKLELYGVDTSQLFVSSFEVDKKGFAYITIGMDSVYAFDLSTGEVIFENKPIPQGGTIRGFYKNDKGEVCVVTFNQIIENDETLNKLIIIPINPKTGNYEKEEIIDAPGGNNSNIAPVGDKFDYYGFTAAKIYGYINWYRVLTADLPSSGVTLSEVTKVIPLSATQFLITGYTQNTIGIEKLYILTKVDPKDVPDKSIITVAAISEPQFLSDYIREFTLTHPQFQVEYKQYAVDSNASYDDALTAFNNDIIAGNIPDVIVIEPEIPYGNYVRKGMLADLYTFLEQDTDYKKEDFLQPVLKAFETDGKLYSIAPAFYFSTLVGKTSIFGEKQGQSFAELQVAEEKIPGASLFGSVVTRDVFTNQILTRMARGFIDDEKGVCNFDSEEFISLLKYAKNLPTPAPDAKPYELRFAPGETNDYMTDKTLFEPVSVYDFRHIVSLEKMEFGEPVTFLGFPNNSGGSGILINPRLETAIMSQSKNPDGAWEFVKGLLSYGNSIFKNVGYPPLGYFPTLMSELDFAAEKTTIPPYETWYGERIPRTNWLGANLSNQPDNTKEDNAKMFELFESIEGIYRENPAIINIISEETAVYFATDKSAEETAKIIQNRATTYLEETK
jgi:ABC-type glycerol-3-phosphate transport system substrate-binding protein